MSIRVLRVCNTHEDFVAPEGWKVIYCAEEFDKDTENNKTKVVVCYDKNGNPQRVVQQWGIEVSSTTFRKLED